MAQSHTRKLTATIDNETILANVLKFALMFHGSPNVQAIAQSVVNRRSFIYGKVGEVGTWTRLSAKGERNFAGMTQVIVAHEKVSICTQCGRRVRTYFRRTCYSPCVGYDNDEGKQKS
eukprot:GHVU01230885.1.p1 GENE.GHVU01230885.1~~GHVU01230885.1.p1  ORF type:complete len:118 (-),score=4.36 GHVU01230885.1:10-363(-)